MDQLHFVAGFQLLVGGVAGVVAAQAWSYRDRPGGRPLVVMGVAVAGWAIAHGIQPYVPKQPTYAIAYSRHLFAAITAIAIFYVAVEYTDNTRLKRRSVLVVLLAILGIDVLVLLTDPIHHSFVTSSEFLANGYLSEDFGVLFWLHTAVWFGLTFVTLGLLVQAFANGSGIYRRQSGLLVAGGSVALFLTFVEQITETVPGLSFSIVGMTIFCLTVLWAIFEADFLETVPVARELLLDNMDDAVFALDDRGRVVDMNRRATDLLGLDESDLGQPSEAVFAAIPGLAGYLETETERETELAIRHAGQERHFKLQITPVVPGETTRSGTDRILGRLFVMRDITEQKRREAELERREEELALLKDLQSRFLRHNLRNRLNIIRSNADFLVDPDDPASVTHYDAIMDASDQLLYWSTEARAIERLIEQDERQDIAIGEYIQQYVEYLASEFPDVDFDVQLDGPVEIVAVPQVERAIENVIDNAARYNTAPDPTVRVRAERHDGTVSVIVADNGPGLNTHEIETIREQGETDLQHGSGFGLWLVYWVVEKSQGDLTFEIDDGTTVTLTFDAAGRIVAED